MLSVKPVNFVKKQYLVTNVTESVTNATFNLIGRKTDLMFILKGIAFLSLFTLSFD